MTSMFVVVLFALFALLCLIRLAKGWAADVRNLEDLRVQIHAVDIESFRLLTDQAEEEFLRSHLTPNQFRSVQRLRLKAMLAYVACVANNAAVLVRLGEEARQSADPSLAEGGKRLVDSALRLRVFALQVRVRLYPRLVFPGKRISTPELANRYEQITRQGQILGRLRYPARGVASVL